MKPPTKPTTDPTFIDGAGIEWKRSVDAATGRVTETRVTPFSKANQGPQRTAVRQYFLSSDASYRHLVRELHEARVTTLRQAQRYLHRRGRGSSVTPDLKAAVEEVRMALDPDLPTIEALLKTVDLLLPDELVRKVLLANHSDEDPALIERVVARLPRERRRMKVTIDHERAARLVTPRVASP